MPSTNDNIRGDMEKTTSNRNRSKSIRKVIWAHARAHGKHLNQQETTRCIIIYIIYNIHDIVLDAEEQHSWNNPKASLHKEFPQRERAMERAAEAGLRLVSQL